MTNQGYLLDGYIFEIDEDTEMVTKGTPLHTPQPSLTINVSESYPNVYTLPCLRL